MRDDELRHLFTTVLAAPPPETVDVDAAIGWAANDVSNGHGAQFTLSKQGRFHSGLASTTLVGTIGDGEVYLRNPEVVEQATEARIVAATATEPAKLLLLTGGKVTAVYRPTSR